MGNYICLGEHDLDILTRRILISMIERFETNANKGLKAEIFFEWYPALFNSPQKKRPAHFNRKRMLILSDNPIAPQDIKAALEKVEKKHPNIPGLEHISPDQVEVKTAKALKRLETLSLEGTSEYADIIAFVNGKKDQHVYLNELINTVTLNRFLFPYLTVSYGAKPTSESIAGRMEKTLYVANKLNDDSKSMYWKKYAFFDKMANLIRNQVSTANRTKGSLDSICNQYGMVLRGHNVISADNQERILVMGDSKLSKENMVEIIKTVGLDPSKFDFDLDYKAADQDLEKLRYSTRYSEIIAGPLPHLIKGTRGYRSGLSLMEMNSNIYPHLVRAIANGELKITKESFLAALKDTYAYSYLHDRNRM